MHPRDGIGYATKDHDGMRLHPRMKRSQCWPLVVLLAACANGEQSRGDVSYALQSNQTGPELFGGSWPVDSAEAWSRAANVVTHELKYSAPRPGQVCVVRSGVLFSVSDIDVRGQHSYVWVGAAATVLGAFGAFDQSDEAGLAVSAARAFAPDSARPPVAVYYRCRYPDGVLLDFLGAPEKPVPDLAFTVWVTSRGPSLVE